MELSLRSVLGLPVMRSAALRTAQDACDRPVRWVSVIELPVEDFVREDELVLTTAMGCGQDPTALEQFVEEVVSSRAAALGIATGRYLDEIPQEVLARAAHHAFPIIEIPWEVRFAEVAQAVSDAMRQEEFGTLEAAQQIQSDVLDLILRGGSLSDVARAVSRRLGSPALIVDARGGVLGRAGGGRRLEDALRRAHALRADSEDASGVQEILLEDALVLQVPIRSMQRLEGYLVLGWPTPAQAPGPGPRQRLMLEHASVACTFWFLQQNAARSAEERFREDFIWSLAKGQVDEDQAIAKGESLGYRVERHHACIVGHPDNLADAPRWRLVQGAPDAPERVRRIVSDEFARSAESLDKSLLVTYQRETFLVYLEDDQEEGLQTVHRFLDRVDRRLHELVPELIMSFGIASVGGGVQSFSLGYQAAREALDIGYRQSGPGHRTASRDVRIYRTLLRLAADPELRALVSDTISPLRDYDARKGGELLPTLSTFIRTRGQISETARLLHLHRQSLIYRLHKIESLTGRSLADPENWFLFSFALRLATLEGELEKPHPAKA